jgi:hypothetical protein
VEKRNAYGVLLGKAEGKRILGRLRRKKVDNTKTDIRVIESGGTDRIHVAQDGDNRSEHSIR